MIEEIKTDNNCIIKAFENNNITILQEKINNKQIHWFKSTDIGKALELSNIYASVQNFDDDEKGLKEVETLGGKQKTLFLTSQGIYIVYFTIVKKKVQKNLENGQEAY